jgi:hypothetical protein
MFSKGFGKGYQWDWWKCTWEVRWKVGKVVLVILRWPERKMGHRYLLVLKETYFQRGFSTKI